MTVCSFCRFLAGAALLLVGLASRVGAQGPIPSSPAPTTKTSSAKVSVTYQIADLVIPVTTSGAKPKGKAGPGKWEDCSTFSRQILETQLLTMLQSTIAPATWNREGATLDYRAQTATLIVNQTPEVQKKVAELLDKLHCQQVMQVDLQLRLVALPVHAIEPLARKYSLNQPFAPAQLDDSHVRRFLESCQKYRACTVTQLPIATIHNGCTSRIQVPSPVATKKVEGEPGQPSLQVMVQPVASADGRNVQVTLRVSRSGVTAQPPLPVFASQYFDPRFPLKSGATAVVAGWTSKDDAGEPMYVALLVTTRVIAKEEKEERRTECGAQCQTPAKTAEGRCMNATSKDSATTEEQESGCEGKCCGPKDPKVIDLVAQYCQACKKGDRAEATRLAVQALALDPTCFCKCGCTKDR